jgi:hypothetical protein
MITHNKRLRNRAQTQPRAAREPLPINLNQRLGLSPKEFSEANGKSATWGYRQIYSGKVKVISDCGRMLIPRSEVDRFLARAGEYNPQSKPKSGPAGNGGEK